MNEFEQLFEIASGLFLLCFLGGMLFMLIQDIKHNEIIFRKELKIRDKKIQQIEMITMQNVSRITQKIKRGEKINERNEKPPKYLQDLEIQKEK